MTVVPEGATWTYEIKLDGFRLEVIRDGPDTTLYSRNANILNERFPYIAKALSGIPSGTILDGELVALGPDGRPSFNLLQNFRSAESQIVYYAFDILAHKSRDLTQLPLSERRGILASIVERQEHVDLSAVSQLSAKEMLAFVREQGLEGVVAKRSDSLYQAGQRTGAWSKHRINLGQEFVIGGYVPSNLGLDSIIIGFYRGKDFIYASRVRAGFVPATRRKVFEQIKASHYVEVPLCELTGSGKWTLGPRTHSREDEGVRLAQARGGGSSRVPGVDWR